MAIEKLLTSMKFKDAASVLVFFTILLRKSRAVVHQRVTNEGKIGSNCSDTEKETVDINPENAYDTVQCYQCSHGE